MPSLPREQRFPGTSLCFDRDCPHCGYAMVYPPVEFADGHTACIWCADRDQRPACWRITADGWGLERIRNAHRYPVLPLLMHRNTSNNSAI